MDSTQSTETKGQKQDQDHDELLLKGISVEYLSTTLLQEINDAGLDINSATVYDLENLKSNSHGLIRRKGAAITCPRDGVKGAAYVDSICEEGATGRASIFLSYTWRYLVKDIVESLKDQCELEGRDIKSTYVWICCFCNNQH